MASGAQSTFSKHIRSSDDGYTISFASSSSHGEQPDILLSIVSIPHSTLSESCEYAISVRRVTESNRERPTFLFDKCAEGQRPRDDP